MKTDLAVVYSPVGGGHRSAAMAVAAEAEARGLHVTLVDAFAHAPRWIGDAYVGTHLTGQNAAPELYGQIYFAADKRRTALEPLRLGLDNLVFGAVAEHIASLEPRAVVATHHVPLVVLARARRRGALRAPVVGVVTDYSAHAHWAERGVDAWAVTHGGAGRDLTRHGVDHARVFSTGIPVGRAFERAPAFASPSLGEPLRVLVTSGGFGHGPMTRVVRSFARVEGVEIDVVCGDNERLVARATEDAKRLRSTVRVFGRVDDMARRVGDAHVVVGKAGGLTITEALTAGRPMVIASAVPGNEKLNESFAVRAGAAVAVSPDLVGAAIAELRARGRLEEMAARARASVPTGAAAGVVSLALSLERLMQRAA